MPVDVAAAILGVLGVAVVVALILGVRRMMRRQ